MNICGGSGLGAQLLSCWQTRYCKLTERWEDKNAKKKNVCKRSENNENSNWNDESLKTRREKELALKRLQFDIWENK